jgi:murein DD-endopeptidase MepM/ murein hydrolase activator NlpD
MDKHQQLTQYIQTHPQATGKVVDYDPTMDKLYTFDFTAANTELSPDTVADTQKFSAWVDAKLSSGNYKYGIGGYIEHRTLYARSSLFNTDEEPRRLHLGIDIWAKAGTPVYAPFAGQVHSFNDNNNFGDYGPTIILEHNLGGLKLYSLYGHLNRESLRGLYPDKIISKNQQLGVFGTADVNGNWPPHLHFQLMFDIADWSGDYPGVGRFSEREKLIKNIPDPELVLRFNH